MHDYCFLSHNLTFSPAYFPSPLSSCSVSLQSHLLLLFLSFVSVTFFFTFLSPSEMHQWFLLLFHPLLCMFFFFLDFFFFSKSFACIFFLFFFDAPTTSIFINSVICVVFVCLYLFWLTDIYRVFLIVNFLFCFLHFARVCQIRTAMTSLLWYGMF